MLGQAGIAFSQRLKASMAFDPGHNGLQFVGSNPLAIVFALFPALQQEVGTLGDGLCASFDFEGLLADMAADHAINLGHLFKDTCAFLFNGWADHNGVVVVA